MTHRQTRPFNLPDAAPLAALLSRCVVRVDCDGDFAGPVSSSRLRRS